MLSDHETCTMLKCECSITSDAGDLMNKLKALLISLLKRPILWLMLIIFLCLVLYSTYMNTLLIFNSSTSCPRNTACLQKALHHYTAADTLQKRVPQVLIVGVRKCGTRALLEMLNLHPYIVKTSSEVHFFDNDDNYMNGLEWYRESMPYSAEGQITIEKTPSYFVSPDAPARIRSANKSMKILIIVREPAVRVLSDYTQIQESKHNKGKPVVPFKDKVLGPDGEVKEEYKAVKVSQYAVYMVHWLREFPLKQIHFVDGDILILNPFIEIKKVQDFLNIPPLLTSNNFYYNETRGFYCLHNGTHHKCLSKSKGRQHPYVDPSVMSKLRQYFSSFNEQFYELVNKNFSWPVE